MISQIIYTQIALLGMQHFVYGTNSTLISASLVRHSLLHFHLSHMAVHHLHYLHYHRLHLLLLARYFILNSTWLFSKSFPPWTFSFPTGLITRTLGPSNDFTLFNGWISNCVRLSRLLVGFRMHFKSLHFLFIHSL